MTNEELLKILEGPVAALSDCMQAASEMTVNLLGFIREYTEIQDAENPQEADVGRGESAGQGNGVCVQPEAGGQPPPGI